MVVEGWEGIAAVSEAGECMLSKQEAAPGVFLSEESVAWDWSVG